MLILSIKYMNNSPTNLNNSQTDIVIRRKISANRNSLSLPPIPIIPRDVWLHRIFRYLTASDLESLIIGLQDSQTLWIEPLRKILFPLYGNYPHVWEEKIRSELPRVFFTKNSVWNYPVYQSLTSSRNSRIKLGLKSIIEWCALGDLGSIQRDYYKFKNDFPIHLDYYLQTFIENYPCKLNDDIQTYHRREQVENALMIACYNGHITIFDFIWSKVKESIQPGELYLTYIKFCKYAVLGHNIIMYHHLIASAPENFSVNESSLFELINIAGSNCFLEFLNQSLSARSFGAETSDILSNDTSIIYNACRYEHADQLEVIELLINHGAPIDPEQLVSWNAGFSKHPLGAFLGTDSNLILFRKIIDELLLKKIDIIYYHRNFTLYQFLKSKLYECADVLIEKNVPLTSALHDAIIDKNFGVLDWLIERKVDLNALVKTHDNIKTPLVIAIPYQEIYDYLLTKGAIEFQVKTHEYLFRQLISTGATERLSSFITRNPACVHLKNEIGLSVLQEAVSDKKIALNYLVIKELIDRGCDIDSSLRMVLRRNIVESGYYLSQKKGNSSSCIIIKTRRKEI